MDQHEIETVIRNIDERASRIEQILPTLATKEDLNAFATKEDVREEGERTRLHFDVVAEGLQDGIKVIADGHKALQGQIAHLGHEVNSVLANHERRITKLEAEASKQR